MWNFSILNYSGGTRSFGGTDAQGIFQNAQSLFPGVQGSRGGRWEFIKQMCESARKFNAITRTIIKRLFKQPNLLRNVTNFSSGFLAFAMSNFSS